MSSEGKDRLRLVLEDPDDIERVAEILAISRRLSEENYTRAEPTNAITKIELRGVALDGLLTALLRIRAARPRNKVSEEDRSQAERMLEQLEALDNQSHPDGGMPQP